MIRTIFFVIWLVSACIRTASSAETTKQELPEKYWGTYAWQPQYDQNYAEFTRLFHHTSNKATMVTLFRDGDYYHTIFYYAAPGTPVELKFKLGELQTIRAPGKNVEYIYTLENLDGSTVLRAKFRDIDTDPKGTTIDVLFTETGFNVTYNHQDTTARQTFLRIPSQSIAGFYESVPEKQSANFLEFANRVFPTPKGYPWRPKTGLWLGQDEQEFFLIHIITPAVQLQFPFKVNEKRTNVFSGKNVTYKITLGEENYTTRSTKLHGEVNSGSGSFNVDAVITPEGISVTYKTADETASTYYRRVLDLQVYGTFESAPEFSENWAEFASASGKYDDSAERTKLQIYRQGEGVYLRILFESGKSYGHLFALNQTLETIAPSGSTVKYTYNWKPSYNDALISAEAKVDGKIFTTDFSFNSSGVYVIYRHGAIVARRFYRRILSAIALGKFEMADASPAWVKFAEEIGFSDLGRMKLIEIGQISDNVYTDKVTFEGDPEALSYPFTLGKPKNITLKGKNINHAYYYFDYPVPLLYTYWFDGPNYSTWATFTTEFNPTGLTVSCDVKGKVETLKYNRVGPPVELEIYPTY